MTTIMKFGGTSVADASAIGRVVALVRRAHQTEGAGPVVVVSAMAGVTDRLLGLAAAAGRGDREAVTAGLDELRRRHEAAAEALTTGERHAVLRERIREQCADLEAMLTAIATLREASPRSLDGVAAAGELLSSRIVAAALAEHGVRSAWVDPRKVIATDEAHTAAAPLPAETQAQVQQHVLPHLEEGAVPVMGGFAGAARSGATTTLGRGGSDYSAALVGAALDDIVKAGQPAHAGGCREIQIWTDVDGMLTADPRIIENARPVAHLSFSEAAELAYFGAKVLHPSTILPAVQRGIPVRILNSRRPDAPGTLVTGAPPVNGRPLAALACKRAVTVIEVTSTRMLMAYGFLRRLFEVFERFRTPVDVVTTSEVSVSVTIDDDRRLGEIVESLREFAEVAVEPQMSLLCAVGDTLRGDPRLAVRILASLEGFPLRMVSQAASRRNLTVVLSERDLPAAMARLHEVWFPAEEAWPTVEPA